MYRVLYFLSFFSLAALAAEKVVIDGNLDEPEWENAFITDKFYQTSPYNLEEAKDKTSVYIFSNKDGIYIGFINEQSNSSMLSNKGLRDEINSLSDKNSINIDFDGDGNKAYILAVTLGDSLFDAIKVQSGGFTTDWDGDWIAKSKKYDGYWVSEFHLPWNVVLMSQPDGLKRKINYSALRYNASEQTWVSSSGTMASRPEFFQKLDSLEIDNFTKSKIDFFPYLSSNYNSITDFKENKFGAELFYNSGKGSQVNLTVNPDFGQAESDDVVINFSAQETFYSEKRAFFNENQSLFNVKHYDRYSVINTRRIGAAPAYDCDNSDNPSACEDSKKNYSDIDFAVRYTQKTKNAEYGFFAAEEADENFSIGRNYYAFRSRAKIGQRTVGHMITHVQDKFNSTNSTVNVIDYVNVKSERLRYFTDILFSDKENKSHMGYRSQFSYQPSNLSYLSGSILYFEDGFQLNDFGYLKRSDWFHLGIGGGIKKIDFAKESLIDQIDSSADLNYDADTSGNSNPLRLDQKNEIIFNDTSKLKIEFGHRTSGKNTTITRKNSAFPFVKIKQKSNVTIDFEAKNYQSWTYDWRISFENGEKYDSWNSEGYKREFYKIAGSYFPADNLKFSAQYRIRKESEWLNWIDNNNFGSYKLEQDTLSFDMNWFKGSKHEIRLKSQFVALDARDPVSLISDGQGYLFNSDTQLNPFKKGVASFQIRYKYEFAPLSYLYLVYSRGGDIYEEDGDMSKLDTFKQPWYDAANEIFSLKFRLKY